LCGSRDQPLTHLARGEQLALAAGEWPVVDADLHRDRRRVDIDEGSGWRSSVSVSVSPM
jgi:hypothetical protein